MRTASVTIVPGLDRAEAVSRTITPDRTWIVGRAPDSDIVIDDSRVSRRHLVVETAGSAWVIRDVSSNGSWAAGVRIGPSGVEVPDSGEVRLHLGDSAGPELVVAEWPDIGPVAVPGGPPLAELPTVPDRPPAMPGRRRFGSRRTRWLVAVLVVVALLFVVADRVAAAVASTQAVKQVVKRSEGLTGKPDVSFGGFPFLTQVLSGKYTDIKVGIDGLTPPGGPHIQHVSAHLKGAHIPLSKALHNNVTRIPVDHVAASVTLGYADLNSFLKNQPGQITLSPGSDGAVNVSAHVNEEGIQADVSGSAKLQADGGELTVIPNDLHVSGAGGLGDLLDSLGGLAGLFPPIPVPLPDLPFNLRIESVHSDSNGIDLAATADHVVLDAGQQ